MGDKVGRAVEGMLYYFPYTEFKRARDMDIPSRERAAIYADMCRLNALYMIARAGSGHIGGSFSSLDISSWLLLEEVSGNDVYFSSKGHDAPGYYAAMMGMGKLEFNLIHKLRKLEGLPGHPDINTAGIITNTGSLGMGVSKAKGMVIANRLAHQEGRVFVMTGDGELQEGQFWESLISAVNFGLHEITVIIDHNKLQSDTFVKNVSDLGNLEAKLIAFGWCVGRCDGNDMAALSEVLRSFKNDKRPKVIIADTIKGKGVSFMEHTSLDSDAAMYRFHSGAPDSDLYQKAAQEIMDRLVQLVGDAGMPSLKVDTIKINSTTPISISAQELIPAYSNALIEQADKHSNIVALDADLILDTGLIPFRDEYPERFVECGIAEQDMVSMAGGMALNGILPVVHSFACFLSTRPNEQIYNNATEKTKIIYVGSLAGVLPGGTGHSHQAIRDISVMAAIPGMIIMEPSCEKEVGLLLDWCVNKTLKSSYMRLMSLPIEIPFELPADYEPIIGQGVTLINGKGTTIISYGPLLLSRCYEVALEIKAAHGVSVKVINFPWLNTIDLEWLSEEMDDCSKLICIDNHFSKGGLSDQLSAALFETGKTGVVYKSLGINEIPPCGTNDEVLEKVKFDLTSLSDLILN